MTKEEKYQSVLPQIRSLLSGEADMIANMANMVAVLHETFGFWWTGFYRVVPNTDEPATAGELVLGPFQGPIACTRIPFNKGVCGTAWAQSIIAKTNCTFSKNEKYIFFTLFDTKMSS